jgi:hypothetical protein
VRDDRVANPAHRSPPDACALPPTEPLYGFGVGVLRWNIRVDAYLLLLDDTYPPFSLR